MTTGIETSQVTLKGAHRIRKIGLRSLWDSPLSRKEINMTVCVGGCQDSARDKEWGVFRMVRGHHIVAELVEPSNAFAQTADTVPNMNLMDTTGPGLWEQSPGGMAPRTVSVASNFYSNFPKQL